MRRSSLTNSARASMATAMVLLGLSVGGAVHGESAKSFIPDPAAATPEYILKAAFLYNFAQFTAWPVRNDRLLQICILGRDPFGSALDALIGKSADGARIAVLRLRNVEEALRSCQIIFVTDDEVDGFIAHIAAIVPRNGVLTIAEREGAARAGIMIELTLSNSKIGFEFNQLSAERSGMTISSKLLRLARKVY